MVTVSSIKLANSAVNLPFRGMIIPAGGFYIKLCFLNLFEPRNAPKMACTPIHSVVHADRNSIMKTRANKIWVNIFLLSPFFVRIFCHFSNAFFSKILPGSNKRAA